MPGCVQQHSFGEKISLQMRGLRPAAAHSPQRARLARLQAEKCFWPGTRPGQKRILYFSRLRARTLRGWPFCKAGWVDRGPELRYSGGGSGRSARLGWKSRALETVTGQGGGWAVLTPGGGCGILKVQKGTAASGQPRRNDLQEKLKKPSPAGVAVSAFYDDRDREGPDVQSNPHSLTPFRESWLTACRLLQCPKSVYQTCRNLSNWG